MGSEVDELRRILLSRQLHDVFSSEAAGRRPGSAPPQSQIDDPGSPQVAGIVNDFHNMLLGNQASYQPTHLMASSGSQDSGQQGGIMLDAAEERLRSDPKYVQYYYANKNFNPRLPPPIVKGRDTGRSWTDKQHGMDATMHSAAEHGHNQVTPEVAEAFNLLFGGANTQQGSAPLNIQSSAYHSQHLPSSVSPPRDTFLSSSPWAAGAGRTEPLESMLAAFSPKTSHLASSLAAMASGDLGGSGSSGGLYRSLRGHSVSADQVDLFNLGDSGLFSGGSTPGRTSQAMFESSGLGSGPHSARSSLSGVPTAGLTGLGKDSKVIGPSSHSSSAARAIGDRSSRHSHTPSKLRIGTSSADPSVDLLELAGSPTARSQSQQLQKQQQQQAAVDALTRALPRDEPTLQVDQQHAAAMAAAAAVTGAADLQGLLSAGMSNSQQQQQQQQQMQAMYMAAASMAAYNPYYPQQQTPTGAFPTGISSVAAMHAAAMYPHLAMPGMAAGGYAGMPGGYGGLPFMQPLYGMGSQFPPGLGGDPLASIRPPPYGMMGGQALGYGGAASMMPQFPMTPEYAQYYAKFAEAQVTAMGALAAASVKDDEASGGGGTGGGGGGMDSGRGGGGGGRHTGRRVSGSSSTDEGARRGGYGAGMEERDAMGGLEYRHERRYDPRNGRDDRADLDRYGGGGGGHARGGMYDRDPRYRDGSSGGSGGGTGYHDSRMQMNGAGERRDARDVRGGHMDTGRRDGRDGRGRRDDGPERRSDPLLEEFKNNKSRKFDFKDIFGHVYEFSLDQHGSRFIQQQLEDVAPEDLATAFAEVLPRALTLMTDVFGNYVIQKLFEHGTPEQRQQLAESVQGHVLQLSLQMYGCRVIQKALEAVDVEQQCKLVAELDGHIMRCVRDQNGNHCVQKAIECVPTARILPMIDSFLTCVVPLSTHPFGCRVIQRILEHCQDAQRKQVVMDEILKATCQLSQDQYGNYVIQHVLERGEPHERLEIITRLAPQIVPMALHKFASNVVEKCLTHCRPPERDLLINTIIGGGGDGAGGGGFGEEGGEDPLQQMSKDQFGNYVVQRVLEVCDDAQREVLLGRVRAQLHALKKYTYGKHIVARVEKLLSTGTKIQTSAKNKALPDDEQLASLAAPPALSRGGGGSSSSSTTPQSARDDVQQSTVPPVSSTQLSGGSDTLPQPVLSTDAESIVTIVAERVVSLPIPKAVESSAAATADMSCAADTVPTPAEVTASAPPTEATSAAAASSPAVVSPAAATGGVEEVPLDGPGRAEAGQDAVAAGVVDPTGEAVADAPPAVAAAAASGGLTSFPVTVADEPGEDAQAETESAAEE